MENTNNLIIRNYPQSLGETYNIRVLAEFDHFLTI
jgi:hypothetical protein